jgi:Zn-dependent metalloprotease
MKKYTLLCYFISLSAYAFAQGIGQQTYCPTEKQIKTPNTNNIAQLEQWLLQNINPNQDFQLKKIDSSKDIAGNAHIRYQQYYKNLPVETSMINLHCKGSTPASFNGLYFPKLNLDLSVKIGATEALEKAKNTFPAQSIFAWEEQATETLKTEGLLEIAQTTAYPTATIIILPNTSSETQKFRLAYQFKLLSAVPLSYKSIFVDPKDGTILLCKDLIYHLDKPGIAHTKYSGIQNITCDSIDRNKYTLIERTRGLDSIIIKQSGGTSSPKLFYDDDNNWNNFNPKKDEIATDIFWGFEQTYDYYKTRFSRNSYDDKGHAVQGNAHPSGKSESAYWIT